MNLSILLVLSSVCLGAPSSPPPPDLSGTWVLDSVKSDFGGIPIPSDLIIKVVANGAVLRATQSGGGQPDMTMTFDTEGKEMVNEFPGGRMKSKHRWEGEILVGEIKITSDEGQSMTFHDKTSLSADGKVQTVERLMEGPGGEARMRMIWNKRVD
jgi:hypothetical protein